MFNIPSFFGFRAGSPFDPDAAAFFARVNIATGSGDFLTVTEKNAVNDLVIDMKNDGIYSLMKAIYPMVGGGTGTLAQKQAACEQNLISSSFTGSFTSGWTFASTGVTGNGSSAYMDTNLFSSVSLSLNNASYTIYSRSNSDTGLQGDFGDKNTIGGFSGIFVKSLGDFYGYIGDLNNINPINANSTGFYLISRRSSTQVYFYKNGAALGINPKSSNSSGLNLGSIVLGRANTRYSNRQYAFASIGDGLTDTEAGLFYTAVQAFQTTLGRAIAP